MQHDHSLATSPTWAPAFAGVAAKVAAVVFGFGWRSDETFSTRLPCSLFTREGGCPVWVPAFAGKHSETAATQC